MKIKVFTDPDMDQNCYLCADEASSEAVLIDPGGVYYQLAEYLLKKPVNIQKILLTHGHYDHMMGAEAVKELTGASILAFSGEKEMLSDDEVNFSEDIGLDISIVPDETFEDGAVIACGGESLKVIHTPGHTSGGVCFYDSRCGVLFSGDTLFRETVGRTDLPTGNREFLLKSIKERLFTLPGNTVVYPGHGESTTIAHEIAENEFVSEDGD
ncbi:MAG: MBL fold metallo-hydrolase [Defluviitaleaceae bacterium]|nr:MBL fold metallo-hydrolase [Defluviitaleaceae bacterium]